MPLFLYNEGDLVPITYDLSDFEHASNSFSLLGVVGLECHPALKSLLTKWPPDLLPRPMTTEREEKITHHWETAIEALDTEDYMKGGVNYFLAKQLEQGPFEEAIRVEQREYAGLAKSPVGTSDLGSCVFVSFCQKGKIGGMHIDFNTDPESIKACLASIPEGQVGIRMVGGLPLHNIHHYRNLHHILTILNNDPKHDFILLSADTGYHSCWSHNSEFRIALCAYPPEDDGFMFYIKNCVPKPRDPIETIAKNYACETLCYPIKRVVGLTRIKEEEKSDLLDEHEKSARILEPLKPAGAPLVGTPLMEKQLQSHLPEGTSLEEFKKEGRDRQLGRMDVALTEVGLTKIDEACRSVKSEEKEAVYRTESIADLSFVFLIDAANQMVMNNSFTCENQNKNDIVKEINISKDNDIYKVEFKLNDYPDSDIIFSARNKQIFQLLGITESKKDADRSIQIKLNGSYEEILQMIQKLENLAQDNKVFYKDILLKLRLLKDVIYQEQLLQEATSVDSSSMAAAPLASGVAMSREGSSPKKKPLREITQLFPQTPTPTSTEPVSPKKQIT